MKILAIDLAGKFSAVCLLDERQVVEQFDSYLLTSSSFIEKILDAVNRFQPDIIAVEDVPYGLSKQFMIKPVLRLQGGIIFALKDYLDIIYFINPATWQRTFEGVYRGKALGAAAAAKAWGYSPPSMLERYGSQIPSKGKERTAARVHLRKIESDYVDAYLIACYVQNCMDKKTFYPASGVQKIDG